MDGSRSPNRDDFLVVNMGNNISFCFSFQLSTSFVLETFIHSKEKVKDSCQVVFYRTSYCTINPYFVCLSVGVRVSVPARVFVTSSPPCCSGSSCSPNSSTTARQPARLDHLSPGTAAVCLSLSVGSTLCFCLFQWFLDQMADDNWWPMQILIKCPNQIVRQVTFLFLSEPSNGSSTIVTQAYETVQMMSGGGS